MTKNKPEVSIIFRLNGEIEVSVPPLKDFDDDIQAKMLSLFLMVDGLMIILEEDSELLTKSFLKGAITHYPHLNEDNCKTLDEFKKLAGIQSPLDKVLDETSIRKSDKPKLN